MYFKRDDIQKVRTHIKGHASEIGAFLIDDDFRLYRESVDKIIEDKGRQYNEGEQLDTRHFDALTILIENIVTNYADAVIWNIKAGVPLKKPITDPTDHLLTIADHYYAMAMQRLGCPDMPVFMADNDVKLAIEESAIKMDSLLHPYDISRDKVFDRQRGVDADLLTKSYKVHMTAIKNQKDKPQHLGELVAEYQALKERQSRHGAIWRFFHYFENQARDNLLRSMETSLASVLGNSLAKNLDTLNPSEIARMSANALIRGKAEVAAEYRVIEKTEEIFGVLDAEKQMAFQETTEKVPMSEDNTFMADVSEKSADKSEPVKENKEAVKNEVLDKDNGGFTLLD